ncbi:MAG: methyltransferase domain-containing protein [Imperialibacter sp.]|uniref:class I SAM-dependent methyltransferase n=1 Tax=Imperialibacter sp. TaxID=2038411 RepID=UPI0032EEA8AF
MEKWKEVGGLFLQSFLNLYFSYNICLPIISNPLKDIHGKAIVDYYQGKAYSPLILHTSYGSSEEMPVEVFFREEEDLSVLDLLALIECKGKVLDLGAGAGVHSLILASRGFEVYALENSPGCVEVMKQSGVEQVINDDYRKHKGKYDTILMLMNGLGLAGKLRGVKPLLEQCMKLLKKGGQILVDSSDISYLYELSIPKPEGYYGEISYKYEYKGEEGDWFDWVYVDQETLAWIVAEMGLTLEILHTDESDQYLARITR